MSVSKASQAQVYFYQEPFADVTEEAVRTRAVLKNPPAAGLVFANEKLSIPQYGIQLVVGSEVDTQSNFRGTGNLNLTRQRVGEYGLVIGKRLAQLKVETCTIFLDQKYKGECFRPSDSKVGWHIGTLVEKISSTVSGVRVLVNPRAGSVPLM